MKRKARNKEETYHFFPIGRIRRTGNDVYLEILEPYRPALKQLDHFSHVIVFWWANKRDNEKDRGRLQTKPPYAKTKLTGVFACRAEYRPNPVAMSTCRMLGVDGKKGMVRVANIDACDGTPVLDLKAYFPVCDRVKEASIPGWLEDWPEWMPEDGLGPEDQGIQK